MATVTTTLMTFIATIGDPDGTRTVTSIIALLVALGLGLIMVAVWLHRRTRPDPELLAPLELMGERRWRRADPVAQRRRLDQTRPPDAEPLTPSAAPPQVDEAFDAGPPAAGFDDLSNDVDADEALTVRPQAFAPPTATGTETPKQLERPDAEQFGEDIDPDVLAAAQAELDAELGGRSDAT